MKPTRWLISTLICCALSLQAQPRSPSTTEAFTQAGYNLSEIGANRRVWSRASWRTNQFGQFALRTNYVVELGAGMGRQVNGTWVESTPELVDTGNGIVGRGARHSAHFPANLNGRGAVVRINLPDDRAQPLKFRVLGLAYEDSATGTNVLIAELKDVAAQLIGSNTVAYVDATTDFKCTIRYNFTKAGVSQELILNEQPPVPEAFGLNSTSSRLVLLSEQIAGAAPRVKARTRHVGRETINDDTLDFGEMRMISGRAFRLRAGADRRQGTPVARQFEVLGGRGFVTERVRYEEIRDDLRKLPLPESASTNSFGTNASLSKMNRWYAQGALPPTGRRSESLTAWVATPKSPPSFPQTASLSKAVGGTDGFLVDWDLVLFGDEYFNCQDTYLVVSEIHLGDAYFEPGVVVEYDWHASLYIDGSLYWSDTSQCGGGCVLMTSINDWQTGLEDLSWMSSHPDSYSYGPALAVQPDDLETAYKHFFDFFGSPGIISSDSTWYTLSVAPNDLLAFKGTGDTASFTIKRAGGDWSQPLTVNFILSGARSGIDYVAMVGTATIAAHEGTVVVPIQAASTSQPGSVYESPLTLTIAGGSYCVGSPDVATVYIIDPAVPAPSPFIAPSGLVSWWAAEQNQNDEAGSNGGTPVNNIMCGPGRVGNNSDELDGDLSVITLGDPENLKFTSAFTIETWLNLADLTGTFEMIFMRGDTRYCLDPYYLALNTSGALRLHVEDNTGADCGVNLETTYPLPLGQWVHVAGTFDSGSGSMKLYTNGVLAAQQTTTVVPFRDLDATGAVAIGNLSSDNFVMPFNGWIDELSVYNRALVANEILGIYNAGRSGKAIAPRIVVQPSGRSAIQGDNVTFTVTASGKPAPGYQWRFNGNPISGATGSAFTTTPVQSSDAGPYSVVVSNFVGSVTSSVATLTVSPPPPCVSPLGNLVSCWPGDGMAWDIWGNNSGSLINGAGFGSGKVGQAFAFDGTSQYVDVTGNAGLNPTAAITAEAWVYPQLPVSTCWPPVIKKAGDGMGTQNGYSLELNSTSPTFWVYLNNNWYGCYSWALLPTEQWSHIAGVYDGTSISVYVNGVLVGSAAASGAIVPSSNHLQIGHDPANQRFFHGKIDEASIYNGALSAGQIQAIYGARSSGKCFYFETGRTTNCLAPASVALSPVALSSSTVCAGASVSASATTTPSSGIIRRIIHYRDGSSTTNNSYYSPTILSNWCVITAPNGSSSVFNGLSASWTPTMAGTGSVTITCWYTNATPPCSGATIVSVSTNFVVLSPSVDSDYDGRTDCQEVTDGTDRFNPLSFIQAPLAYWKFANTNTWIGEQSQSPLAYANVQGTASWTNYSAWLNSSNTARLAYRDVEANGNANINCRNGSLMFWFKPDWASATVTHGLGPQTAARLVELGVKDTTNGCWSLLLSTNGTELSFITQTNGAGRTNFIVPVTWKSSTWHQLALTYSTNNSCIYLDGAPLKTNGWGVAFYPNSNVRASFGLNIGSDKDGNQQARGQFQELKTYNYVLTAQAIKGAYQSIATNQRPVILRQPASQTILAGQNAQFSAGVSSPTPLTYQWKIDGANLPRALTSTFTRTNAQTQHQGNYSVVVNNSAGSATSSNALLTVNVLPVITVQPHGGALCGGDTITLTGSATGTAPLSYQWQKMGVNISGATGTSYTLTSVAANAGTYNLMVTNVAGAVSSIGASVTIGQAVPTLQLTLTNSTNCILGLVSPQSDQFVSAVHGTNYSNNHPTAIWVQAPYADAFFGMHAGCSNSLTRGVNLTKLSAPVFDPAGATFYYPSNVVIKLGLEDLTNLVDGLYATELARTGSPDRQSKINLAINLRTNSGYSDEEIRANLINGFRVSSDYVTNNGAVGDTYNANTHYLIEYSLNGGTNWSAYTGPIPVSGSMNIRARVSKALSADARTVYAYITSDCTDAAFIYSPGQGTYPNGDGTDLFNVRFAPDAYGSMMGQAAIGYSSGDFWNMFTASSSNPAWYTAFHDGFPLLDSNAQPNNVRLWAYTGPYQNGSFAAGTVPNCDRYNPWDWSAYWTCWGSAYAWLLGSGYAQFDFPWLQCTWNYGTWGLYDNLSHPDFWSISSWLLPRPSEVPLWLPALDKGYWASTNAIPADTNSYFASRLTPMASGPPEDSDIMQMVTTGLTSHSRTDMEPWLGMLVKPTQWPTTTIVITGLHPGYYGVYLYGWTPATVNSQPGRSFSWRKDQELLTIPTTYFTALAQTPAEGLSSKDAKFLGILRPGWPTNVSWTQEPIWVSKLASRITINYRKVDQLAGMQIIRVPAPGGAPTLCAWPGKKSVALSWTAVPDVLGYQIFRSQEGNTNFTLAASTSENHYADAGLAPSTTYSYYVVASNDLAASPPSAPIVSARTFGDPPALPFYGATDGNPTFPWYWWGWVTGGSDGGGGGTTTNTFDETIENTPPTLNGFKTLELASQGGKFAIPFIKVLAVSDASDPDGDPISFKVDTVLNGTLKINGSFFDPQANSIVHSWSTVIWEPYANVPEGGLPALQLRAFDGHLVSATNADLTIIPAPKTALYGWGHVEDGSLGNGENIHWTELTADARYYSYSSRLLPQKVKGLEDASLARHDTGARGAAVTPGGQLWMWGSESGTGIFGEGQPSSEDIDGAGHYPYPQVVRSTPFPVEMYAADGRTLENFTNVFDVSLGYDHVLALRGDGSLWSWGNNDSSQLGRDVDWTNYINDYCFSSKKAGRVTGFIDSDSGQEIPVVQAIAGDYSSLALCQDGSVWWWGEMDLNQLVPGHEWIPQPRYLTPDGLPTSAPSRQTAFDSGPKVTQIAGNGRYCVALREDGSVWEFGFVPRLYFFGYPTNLTGCECAYSYCNFTSTPLQVTNLPLNVAQIRAGGYYALALLSDGRVYAWGIFDSASSIDPFHSANPTLIPGLTNIVAIDLDRNGGLALALDKDGHIWSWGQNEFGQMQMDPDSSPWFFDHPQPILGIENAKDIVSGSDTAFTIASLEEGKPTGLMATALDQKIRLDWRSYPGASSYFVYRANGSDYANEDTYTNNVGNSTRNTFVDTGGATGLSNNVLYAYEVSAMVDGHETPRSRYALVVPVPPPGPPSWHDTENGQPVPAAWGTCRNIHLQWNPATNAVQYRVFRTDGTNQQPLLIATLHDTSFVDSSIAIGNTNYFTYQVTGINSSGEGNPSASSPPVRLSGASCPPAPEIIGLRVDDDAVVTVTWKAVTGAYGSVTNYDLQWYYNLHDRAPGPSTSFVSWTSLSLDPQSYPTDTNGVTIYSCTVGEGAGVGAIPGDQLVWFKVAAVVDGERGPDSTIAGPILPCGNCPAFDPPSGLLAIPGCRQVYLEWNDDTRAAYFQVQYRTNLALTNWITAGDRVLENRFWHTNLVGGTNYQYRIKSWTPVYDSGQTEVRWVDSGFSTNLEATPFSCTQLPTNAFTAQAEAYDSMVYIHWESLTNQPPLLCYLERRLAGGTNEFTTLSDTGYGLAYLDQDVVNNITYEYRVTALDSNYYRFQRTVSATPASTGFLTVNATPGNAHVSLSWTPMPFATYQVKYATTPRGPYTVLATDLSDPTFLHRDLMNEVTYYYVVTAILTYGGADSAPVRIPFDSPEVSATPLARLNPMAPKSFMVRQGMDQNGHDQLLFSWSPSPDANYYAVNPVPATGYNQIYQGPATSFTYPAPTGVTNDQRLTFQVVAFNSGNLPSDPARITLRYEGHTPGANNQVQLAIAGHDVLTSDDGLAVTGPTNLVLHASVTAVDGADATVYFYDFFEGATRLIGTGTAPNAQVTWLHVPQGVHHVMAQAITQSSMSGMPGQSVSGVAYNSYTCTLTNTLIPDLATYQTAVTDLQLPAPGLPISLSRSYDSRNTNAAGCLGKGWSASWDQAGLQISTPLSGGWQEAGMGTFARYTIADPSNHLITVTLPGGAAVYFGAQLSVVDAGNPLGGRGDISLSWPPFVPNQGQLSYSGHVSRLIVSAGNIYDWNGDSVQLVTDYEDTPFIPLGFTYQTPDGTSYIFQMQDQLTGKLVSITDRNGNSLTYNYRSFDLITLTNIQHSNGRQIQFDYQTNGPDAWINVYDSAYRKTAGTDPVLKYRVTNQLLAEVQKLSARAAGSNPAVYDTNWFSYGGSAANTNRLTDLYDAAGVRVLHNEYGGTTNNPPLYDGRLVSQADALNHTNYFGLNADNTLTLTSTVNGASETVTIAHDGSGAIASAQVAMPAGAQSVTNTYDERGLLISQTDSYGNKKTITYDAQDRPVSQSDALGNTTSTVLDALNQPLLTVDANQSTNYFVYDESSGNLLESWDALGTHSQTAYAPPITNASGLLAAGLVATELKTAPDVADYSLLTAYTYYTQASPSNAPGELQSVVEAAADTHGNRLTTFVSVTNTYEYDANGNRTKETRWATVNGTPNVPLVTQYRYDPQNRVVQTIDPLGRTNTVVYDKLGRQASTTDGLGRTTSYTYDALGNLIETVYPDASVTRTTYDEKRRAVYTQDRTMPDANNVTTAPASKTVYDSAGQVIRVERWSGVMLVKTTGTVGGPFQGRTGAAAQYSMSLTNAGSYVSATRTVYDLDGRVQYAVDAGGALTENRYDEAGRRTNVIVYSSFTLDPASTAAIQIPSNAVGISTSYGFDPNGNQVWVRDALGHATTNEFDADNRLVRTWFPYVSGDFEAKSRKTTYDGFGRKVRETDEAGVITAYEYDFRGLLTAVTQDFGPNGTRTIYSYDVAGNLLSQTDANSHTTTFQYDQLGRRTKRTLPDSTFETTAYTDVAETTGSSIKAQRVAMTDFNGRTITTTNDRLDRIVTKMLPKVRLPDNTLVIAATTLSYAYHTNGQRAQVIQSGGVNRTNRYAYDQLGRLRVKSTPEGTLTYQYNSAGAVTQISARSNYTGWAASPPYAFESLTASNANPNGAEWNYRYDVLGRLQKVNPDSSAPDSTADAAYAYDLVGNLQSTGYRNGLTTTYSYNERNWLRMLETRSNNAVVARFDYDGVSTTNWSAQRRLSATGQRRRVAELIGSSTRTVDYDYDPLRRLIGENIDPASSGPSGTVRYDASYPSATTEGYDPVGNRRARRLISDNGLSTAGLLDYNNHVFDSRDRLIQDVSTHTPDPKYDANGNTTNYGSAVYLYDAENRLVKQTGTGSDVTITYDADGNRVKKVVGTTTTAYLVDDKNLTGYAQVMEERDSTGSPAAIYVYGLSLLSQKRGGAVSYYGYDGLGSVRYLSATNGGVTDAYTYDAFGIQIAATGNTTNYCHYTGQQWDPDLGMYYLRARYYRPELGRFWTMDTFEGQREDPLSLHKYLYCDSDPANGVDPSGHMNAVSVMSSVTMIGYMAANVYMRYGVAINRVSVVVFEASTGNTVMIGGGAGVVALKQGGKLGGVCWATWQYVGNLLQGTFRKIGTKKELSKVLEGTGWQANHLNQARAFENIPYDEGVSVALELGTNKKGGMHWRFHDVLEASWEACRKLGKKTITNAEYDKMMRAGLEAVEIPPEELKGLAKIAEESRVSYGYHDGPQGLQPRVPGRIPMPPR